MSSGATQFREARSLFSRQLENDEDRAERIDFKMVTFSLGGKDYGIDIMKVKEIAKFSSFTYVPNTPPFVSGVYNLRGDIISIIDLRIMLNLPVPARAENQPDDGLILRLDAGLIGVIVDSIDRVVGISSETIQPPHPIFADINLKYISGVVEHDDKLYIILDVERILGKESTALQATISSNATGSRISTEHPEPFTAPPAASAGGDDVAKEFVAQALASLKGFYVSAVNRSWFDERFASWAQERGRGEALQLRGEEDAEAFLQPFYSAYSDRFWGSNLISTASEVLNFGAPSSLTVWNPGCGRGHETYSIAGLLRRRFPEARLKVWAGDNDLLNVSTAPTLVFGPGDVPAELHDYLVQGKNGYSFTQEITDLILFEFSDILHAEGLPPVDVVLARDLISFLPPEAQVQAQRLIHERLRTGGIVIVGDNEALAADFGFEAVGPGSISVYRK